MVIDILRKTYRLKELLECLKPFKISYFYQKDGPDQYRSLRQALAECLRR